MTSKGQRRGGRVEPVWERNAEVCHELWMAGINPADVQEDSLTTRGYMLYGLHTELGVPVIERDNPVRTFVEWPSPEVGDKVFAAAKREFMKKFYGKGEN